MRKHEINKKRRENNSVENRLNHKWKKNLIGDTRAGEDPRF